MRADTRALIATLVRGCTSPDALMNSTRFPLAAASMRTVVGWFPSACARALHQRPATHSPALTIPSTTRILINFLTPSTSLLLYEHILPFAWLRVCQQIDDVTI